MKSKKTHAEMCLLAHVGVFIKIWDRAEYNVRKHAKGKGMNLNHILCFFSVKHNKNIIQNCKSQEGNVYFDVDSNTWISFFFLKKSSFLFYFFKFRIQFLMLKIFLDESYYLYVTENKDGKPENILMKHLKFFENTLLKMYTNASLNWCCQVSQFTSPSLGNSLRGTLSVLLFSPCPD